jgi:hypothetical protein
MGEAEIAMTIDRKKPGVAFWATVVVVVVLFAYPLSYGPWLWICGATNPPDLIRDVGSAFFSPISKASRQEILPESLRGFYIECGFSGLRLRLRLRDWLT